MYKFLYAPEIELTVVDAPDTEVVDSKVILPPPAGACHSSPVAVALFATIFQEQSQRIVLRGLKPVNPQQLNQGQQV